MSTPSTVRESATRSTGTSAPDGRLHGRWLLMARVSFLVLTATVVALNLVALPDIAASQLTPDVLKELHQQHFSPTVYALVGVAEALVSFLVYLGLSLLVFWRRSEEGMALFCAVMLVTFGGVAASPLDDATAGGPMPQPLASIGVLRVLVHLLVVVGQVSFVVFFYLFPSGRFVPRWTRWFALLALAYWFADIFFPAQVVGPQGSLILVFWLVAIIGQVYRYRRVSTSIEREQTKWIMFGFVLAFVIVGVPSLIQVLLPAFAASVYTGSVIGGLVVGNTWVVAVLLVPIVIAVAILRSRLWDIDVIINRALVYGSLTVLLAALYFACVVGLQSLSTALTHQTKPQPVAVVASTLLIAALFQPLRRRLQAGIDRRFYRRKYDAERTLTAFGQVLRQELDLEQLEQHLTAAIEDSMQPAHVSLWLRASGSKSGH